MIRDVRFRARIPVFSRKSRGIRPSILKVLPLLLALPGVPRADTAPAERLVMPLALPTPSTATAAPTPSAADDSPSLLIPETKAPATEASAQEIRHEVARGDTLAAIFSRHGLPDATLMALLETTPEARMLARLQPGDTLTLRLSPDGRRLEHVALERRQGTALVFDLPATTPVTAEQHKHPAATTSPATRTREIVHRIRRGETLAGIFKKYGLAPSVVHQVLHSGKPAKALSHIRPGQELRFELGSDGQLQRLTFTRSPIERLLVTQADTGYRVRVDKKKVEHRIATVAGTIHSSLFADGQKAGLSDSQIMELAEIFGWDIDFALEIRAGDQFRVVFDEQLVDGKKYANGPILAAEFVNRGKTYTAFRFEHDGEVGYYDAQGHSKRRAFIRTPIRFARISSRFTLKRWHPVLKKWRSHKGVDYAAPRGTPVKATGDGKVVFRGWKGGYGRVVVIQHGRKYQTVYAHMSRFRRGVRTGSVVRQGQVIGYVGQSGLATGPHLHYEFRVNGRHRNPLTVKLPRSLSLPRRQLAAFKRQTAPLAQQLASLRAKSMVAKNDL